jgi:hypothetical protein
VGGAGVVDVLGLGRGRGGGRVSAAATGGFVFQVTVVVLIATHLVHLHNTGEKGRGGWVLGIVWLCGAVFSISLDHRKVHLLWLCVLFSAALDPIYIIYI